MTALRADGPYGQIEFDGELVSITRDGWRASGPRRTFRIADVERVEFREGSPLVNGHLRYVLPGIATRFATNDPNGVVFPHKSTGLFREVFEASRAVISERGELSQQQVDALGVIYRDGADEADALNRADSASRLAEIKRRIDGAVYAGHIVDHKGYRYGLGSKRPIAGASAEFESGADRSRPTLTRIGAGALLAGPVGAIAGGMFKKDRTKAYVTIVFPDGATVIIDGPAKDEKKMRQFASAVNSIASTEAQRQATERTAT